MFDLIITCVKLRIHHQRFGFARGERAVSLWISIITIAFGEGGFELRARAPSHFAGGNEGYLALATGQERGFREESAELVSGRGQQAWGAMSPFSVWGQHVPLIALGFGLTTLLLTMKLAFDNDHIPAGWNRGQSFFFSLASSTSS